MHLGFHIYDVGFQSPNVEAAKPMVYATAVLLLLIVVLLNLTAIIVRNRLRKKYGPSHSPNLLQLASYVVEFEWLGDG